MKTKSASHWSAAQSEEHYGFKRWGANHFSVDSEGFVQVAPLADGRTVTGVLKGDDGKPREVEARLGWAPTHREDKSRPKLAAAFLAHGREIRLSAHSLPG